MHFIESLVLIQLILELNFAVIDFYSSKSLKVLKAQGNSTCTGKTMMLSL